MKKPSFERSDAAAQPFHFPYSPDIVPGIVFAIDLVVIAIATAATYLAIPAVAEPKLEYYVFCAIFVGLVYCALAQRAGFYAIGMIMQPFARADDILIAQITSFFLFMSVIIGLDDVGHFHTPWILYFFGASTAGLIAARFAVYVVLRGLSRRKLLGRSMVVLGTGAQASRFLARLGTAKPYFSYMVGVFGTDPEHLPATFEDQPVLGGLDDLLSYARRQK
uniref:hypothetical protein n=1 Tax=Rubrimonas sp. TaxID=2036015 RepID=UPI002FDD5E22